MSDETQPNPTDNQAEPQPVPTTSPGWLEWIPREVRMYLLVLFLWAMSTVAAVLAMKYGLNAPPPPPVIVDGKDQAKEGQAHKLPVAVVDDAPPPDPLGFCGLRENLLDRLTAKPWPNQTIKWSLDTTSYAGNLSHAQLVEAFDVAWKAWARDLDINPTLVTDESTADVRCRFGVVYDDDGRADGRGNILAWSELSDGSGKPRRQMYDRAEPWTISSSPGQAQIDVVRVAAHEIGHAMGLVHAPVGAPELMAPTYSRTIQLPTAGDVERMIALGYPRRQSGSAPAPTIKLEVSADPEKLAELLRRNGYKVELQKR